jgi:hypothetical protein
MRHRNAWVILVAAVIGCSSSSGSSGTAAGGGGGGTGGAGGGCPAGASPNACFGTCNPCTRLTDAQVNAAVGVTVSPGSQYPDGGGGDSHSCTWIQYTPLVQVLLDSNVNADTFSKICGAPSGGGLTVTPVAGVGDSACYTQIQGLGGPILNFERGCWGYSLSISGPSAQFPDATMEADEKTLALDALPNL